MTQAVDAATRSAQTGLEIAAPVESVWRALTEPREIVRWFALDAEVEPGVGGTVTWRWADAYRWSTRIELWEPLRRLRLAYTQARAEDHTDLLASGTSVEGGHELVVDFEIEAVSGGTWLRCVHSGFGRDAAWDQELEGVRRGWLAELESMRHYLERHPQRDRRAWWAFLHSGLSMADAWRALVPRLGEHRGLIRCAEQGALAFDVAGLETSLVPVRLDPPGDLVARVRAWDDAMLRIWIDAQQENNSMVSLFLSFYGRPSPAEDGKARTAMVDALRTVLNAAEAEITVLESA